MILLFLHAVLSIESKTPDIPIDETPTEQTTFSTNKFSGVINNIKFPDFVKKLYIDELNTTYDAFSKDDLLSNSDVVLLCHADPTLCDGYKFYRILAQNRMFSEMLRLSMYENLSSDDLKKLRANRILNCINEQSGKSQITIETLNNCLKGSELEANLGHRETVKKQTLHQEIISALKITSKEVIRNMNDLIDHLNLNKENTSISLYGERLTRYFANEQKAAKKQWDKSIEKYLSQGTVTISELISIRVAPETMFDEISLRRLCSIDKKSREIITNGFSSMIALYRTKEAYTMVRNQISRYIGLPNIDSYVIKFLKAQINSLDAQLASLEVIYSGRKEIITAFLMNESKIKTVLDASSNKYIKEVSKIQNGKNSYNDLSD